MDELEIINSFIQAIVESSIDCSVHHDTLTTSVKEKIHCKLCSPTDEMLFHPLLSVDMQRTSNCVPYKTSKVQAKQLTTPSGVTAYYTGDDVSNVLIYTFNPKINALSIMRRDNPMYDEILDAVIAALPS